MSSIQQTSDFETALATFVRLAQAKVDAHFGLHFPNSIAPEILLERGKRYIRIIKADRQGSSRSAYAFVDMTNGDVLKPDGWKGPAKGKRGNIFDPNPAAGVTPYGAISLR